MATQVVDASHGVFSDIQGDQINHDCVLIYPPSAAYDPEANRDTTRDGIRTQVDANAPNRPISAPHVITHIGGHQYNYFSFSCNERAAAYGALGVVCFCLLALTFYLGRD